MKELQITDLLSLKGGDANNWVAGFCGGVWIATAIAPNPVSGVASIGCGVWGIGTAFDWW